MKQLTIGIVDYGVGNHSSVMHFVRNLGFRVLVSSEITKLNETDILIIPGVGAFPKGMQELQKRGLVDYLKRRAIEQHPIVGICLGMQLLTSGSYEFEFTSGLNIIPGEIVPLNDPKWHIGWNDLECPLTETSLRECRGCSFYFNHSFMYQGPLEYQIGFTNCSQTIAAVIKKGNTVGIQFHPEKSQESGKKLLKTIFSELVTNG